MRKKSLISWLVISLIVLLNMSSLIFLKASQADYRVYRILDDGSFSDVIFTTSDFNQANQKMLEVAAITPNVVVISSKSKSPLQIVATDRGYVQSYPFRKGAFGNKSGAANTLSIFGNKNLTGSALTYIGAHYKMFYHQSEAVGDNIALKISFEGTTGYIDSTKGDIIPFIFVEKGFLITIGGNENYYDTPEAKYAMRIKPDHYLVNYDGSTKTNRIYHITTRSWYTNSTTSLSYGIAPAWLPVGMYYSLDGVSFYYDIDLKNPVKNGAEIGRYYNYFLWLPIRTFASYTGQDYHDYLQYLGRSNSIIYGQTSDGKYKAEPFKTMGDIHRMNSLMFFAQAALESAYGTSSYARNRFNLFGWNAYDSAPDNASYYQGIEDVVERHMSANMMGYVNQTDWRFGIAYGNKATGISVQYASDPYYGKKVSSIATSVDRYLGGQEYNKYFLGKLKDKTAVNIRATPSLSGTILYVSKGTIVNQIMALESLDKYGDNQDFYKFIVPVSNKQTTATYGYVHDSMIEILEHNIAGQVSQSQVADGTETHPFIVEALLNFRASPSTSSTSLGTIPSGTIITGTLTNNGWIKTTYNGKTGYITYEYASIYSPVSIYEPPVIPTEPEEPIDPDPIDPDPVDPEDPTDPEEQVLGDINGDGEIDIVDFAMLRSHMLRITTLSGAHALAADFNNDGEIDIVDFAMLRSHMLGIKRFGE